MDILLVVGLVVGLAAVLTGMILKGASIGMLLNGEALMIIFIGTAAAVMNSYPKKEFMNIPRLFGVLFSDKEKEDPVTLIKQMVEMAQTARREGLLSLEKMTEQLNNEFMKKGLGMVVDGIEQEYVRDVLNIEIEAKEQRHKTNAGIFTTAGGSAPTLGVLGAVVGLIGALGNLEDTDKLGESISSAFVATLFGIFTGYVVWHPFASRLKRKSHDEISNMYIIVEGLLAIQAGESPNNVEMKLVAMLDPADRARY